MAERSAAKVTFGWRASRGWSWRAEYPTESGGARGYARLRDAADAALVDAGSRDATLGRLPPEAVETPSDDTEGDLRAALEGLRFYADKRSYRRHEYDSGGRPSNRSSVDADGGAMARLLLARLDPARIRRRARNRSVA